VSVSQRLFGRLADGQPVVEHTLDNGRGLLLRVIDLGGIVTALHCPDRPGALADITRIIGEAGGNIIDVIHQRLFMDVPAKGADVDLLIVVGTTLNVYPAAMIATETKAKMVVLVDPMPPDLDVENLRVIPESATVGIRRVVEELKRR
jgi:hypothetical protein